MLFLLVMEVLNVLIRKDGTWSLFKPLRVNGIAHPSSFYTDDLVWFVAPDQKDLQLAYTILSLFEECSGLGCNLNKCQLAPIRCTPEQVTLATSLFPCQLVEFPVKFLGIQPAVSKLSRSALEPLLDRIADRLLVWKGRLLHHSGQLTLIKTTLSAVLVYTSISLGIPPWLLKALQKLMTAFLWTGTDMIQGGKCLATWKCVQRPLHLGGFGVLDLKLLGTALHSRWLWLQYMDPDRPWASMNIAEDKQSTTFFFASVRFNLSNGATFLFWVDPWLEGKCISEFALDLVDVVPVCRRRRFTVAVALQGMFWTRDIKGAQTVQVLVQYMQLYQRLQAIQLTPSEQDRLEWRWSSNGSYSSRSAYAALMLGQSSVLGAKELWKAKAPNNCHFFIWLALLGRCWTTERLHRHGIRPNNSCILCC
jgi:hypothetical protein